MAMAQEDTAAAIAPVLVAEERPRAGATGALRLSTKVLYGVGGMTEAIKAFSFGVFLVFFYTTVAGVPGTLVGLAAAIGLGWDAVIDPIIGFLSDRTPSAVMRRHGFMVVGAIMSGLAFWSVFRPPAFLSVTGLVAWLIVITLVLRTAMSCFTVPYQALGAELSSDYDERTSVAAYRAAGGLAGSLIAAVLAFGVFLPAGSSAAGAQFRREAYSRMGVGLGSVMTLAALIAVLGTLGLRGRDRDRGTSVNAGTSARVAFGPGLIVALQQPAFRSLVLSSSLFFLAIIISASTSMHYLTWYAGIGDTRSVGIFQLAFYIGALAGIGLWMALARRVDKHRLYCSAMLATGLILAGAYVFVGKGRLLGTGHLLPLCLGHGLAGLWASALWVLPSSIVADVVDEDELVTGERREGIFFGLSSCALQVAAGIALIATGVLLEHFARLVPGSTHQSAETIERIGMLFGLLPAALVTASALLLVRFPLTRGRVRAVQAELTAAREARQRT